MTDIVAVNPKRIAYQTLRPWKYITTQNHCVQIPIYPPRLVYLQMKDGETITSLTPTGELFIRHGYKYDGPSGPTIDTKNFMRGSLYHDVLYQFMRAGKMDKATYKDKADRLLQSVCLEDGMSSFRAWYVYQGVRFGGGSACEPGFDPINEETTAP